MSTGSVRTDDELDECPNCDRGLLGRYTVTDLKTGKTVDLCGKCLSGVKWASDDDLEK